MDFDKISKKKKKFRRTVIFDEEIITKDTAKGFLPKIASVSKKNKRKTSNSPEAEITLNEDDVLKIKNEVKVDVNSNLQDQLRSQANKRKKIKQSNEAVSLNANDAEGVESASDVEKKKHKKKSLNQVEKIEESETNDNTNKLEIKQTESIRAQKRKKHVKLLEEKRLKTEILAQQNALNYLSKWKHSRSDWKFEKLKQIWLQQNLFDYNKIPNEFWDVAVQYFSGSKGYIRSIILKEALNIVEKEEKSEAENADEEYLTTLQRARDIVQNLQE